MSERDRYKNFSDWESANHDGLKREYIDYIEKNYNWVEPDTYVSFDDFCLGHWQKLS